MESYDESDYESNKAMKIIKQWVDRANTFSDADTAYNNLEECLLLMGNSVPTIKEIKAEKRKSTKSLYDCIQTEIMSEKTFQLIESGKEILKEILKKFGHLPLSTILNPNIVESTIETTNGMIVRFINGTEITVSLDVYHGALCEKSHQAIIELEGNNRLLQILLRTLIGHLEIVSGDIKQDIASGQPISEIIKIIRKILKNRNIWFALIEINDENIERNKKIIKHFGEDYSRLTKLYESNSERSIEFYQSNSEEQGDTDFNLELGSMNLGNLE